MSIQRPSCFFNLCSSCSSRSNKRRRDCLLPPPVAGYAAAQAAPPTLLHRWPSHPSTHPHLLLFSGDGRRTSKPLHSPPHGKQLSSLPWPHVVPFLGLAVIHRPGTLSAPWSTWSMNNIHWMWTLCGEADSRVHSRTQGNASLLHTK